MLPSERQLKHFVLPTGLTGFVQDVTSIQQSKQSSNLYFDVHLQVSNDQTKIIRVMHQKGEGTKRQLFNDKMTAQQPIRLRNLPLSASGTLFLNKGTTIEDVPPHSINFEYFPQTALQVTKISHLVNCTSGLFNVSGKIKWKTPHWLPSEKPEIQVRDATLTDSSGAITLSVWGELIAKLKEDEFYTFSACKLRFYYGKCLATTRTTTISIAEKQDLSAVPHEEVQNWICCPEILNVSVNVYAVCNNKECRKKISGNPGSNMVKCFSCKRSMLMKNCYLDMNVNFQLEKEEKSYSITAFPKAVSSYIKEDIYLYKDNTDALVAKLLVLEKVDFQLSQSGKIVAKIQDHETSSESVGKIEDKEQQSSCESTTGND